MQGKVARKTSEHKLNFSIQDKLEGKMSKQKFNFSVQDKLARKLGKHKLNLIVHAKHWRKARGCMLQLSMIEDKYSCMGNNTNSG